MIEVTIASLEARVTALEAGAEADLVKAKAVVAKVVAYSKTSGGLAVVAAVGYVVAKFDVFSLIAKLI